VFMSFLQQIRVGFARLSLFLPYFFSTPGGSPASSVKSCVKMTGKSPLLFEFFDIRKSKHSLSYVSLFIMRKSKNEFR
jgi:hypothetical protein